LALHDTPNNRAKNIYAILTYFSSFLNHFGSILWSLWLPKPIPKPYWILESSRRPGSHHGGLRLPLRPGPCVLDYIYIYIYIYTRNTARASRALSFLASEFRPGSSTLTIPRRRNTLLSITLKREHTRNHKQINPNHLRWLTISSKLQANTNMRW
jgi:hypothetical protein